MGAVRSGNIKLTLSVDKEILKRFREYCLRNGFVMSKFIENFMRTRLLERSEHYHGVY